MEGQIEGWPDKRGIGKKKNGNTKSDRGMNRQKDKDRHGVNIQTDQQTGRSMDIHTRKMVRIRQRRKRQTDG